MTDPATADADVGHVDDASIDIASVDVVVVGGGAAGLVAAYELSRSGLRPLVVEASLAIGGSVRRHRVGGLDLDAGAESFALATGSVQALVEDLGLADSVVRPMSAPAWVRHATGSAPLPGASWLGIPGHPTAPDVRRVIGWWGSARALFDRVAPAWVGRSSTSLGELVQHRLGPRVLRRLVEPVVGGVYSTDPRLLAVADLPSRALDALRDHSSLAGAALSLRGGAGAAGSLVAGLTGGMYELITALAAAIEQSGGRIALGTTVRATTRDGDGWRTTMTSETGLRTVGSAGVVIATSAAPALSLLGLAQASPAAAASVVLCTLVVRSTALDDAPRGSGVLVSGDAAGVRAKALTHATAKWAWLAVTAGTGRHVLRLSYGRGDGRELPAAQDFPAIALADASDLLGIPLGPDQLQDWALTTWPAVAERTSPVTPTVIAAHGRAVTGAWLAGTGLAAVVGHARTTARDLVADLSLGPTASVTPAPTSRRTVLPSREG